MICANMIAFGKAVGATKPYKARLEYLESTGTQWIDTGVIYNTTDRFDIFQDICFIDSSQQRGSGWGAGGGVVYQSGHYDTGNSQMGTDPISISERLNATIVVQGTSSQYSYTGGGKTKTATRSNSLTSYAASTGYPFGQITTNGGAMYTGLSALLYGIKIYVNATAVCSLIPVLDTAGVACMYDEVSGEFFYNQGTGEFVAGPEIIEYTAKDYIQDGLVRHIDGIENVGLGLPHDASALGWKDLATNEIYPFSIDGEVPNWQDSNCWRSVDPSDAKYFIANFPDLATTDGGTVEVVVKKNSNNRGVIIGSYSVSGGNSCSFEYMTTAKFRAYYSARPDMQTDGGFTVGEKKNFVSLRNGSIYEVYMNGGLVQNASTVARLLTASPCYIGSDGRTTSMCFAGDIYAIRIYNRALTTEEIAYNYSIDK